MTWRPIDTAPWPVTGMVGVIAATSVGRVLAVSLHSNGWGYGRVDAVPGRSDARKSDRTHIERDAERLTHWMPMPAGPA